ncbi:MAG TPA: hypothetical protein VGK61_09865 [Planctomycetota bacterium]|jgi:hypothetical protein
MEDSEPLWKRIFLNELVLAAVAALIILYVAFRLATGRETLEDPGKPVRTSRP